MGYKSLAQIPTHRNRPVSSNVRPHIFKTVPCHRPQKQNNGSALHLQKWKLPENTALQKQLKPHTTNWPAKRRQEESGQRGHVPTHQRHTSNYLFGFRSCPTKVIPVRGWRFAPACCAAQSVFRRGPSCAKPLHRLAWAALNLHRLSELHQPSASADSMKTVHASLSFGVRRPKWCGLTGRSTGHFAAGRVWASKA